MLRRIDPSSPISPAASTSGSRPAGVASYSHSPTGAQRPAPPSPAGAARSAARIFTLRIRDVVWRDDPKEPEARWAFVMRECKIACPPTLPEFYQRVERRFGLRPGVVRYTPATSDMMHTCCAHMPFAWCVCAVLNSRVLNCSSHAQSKARRFTQTTTCSRGLGQLCWLSLSSQVCSSVASAAPA